MSSNNQNEHLRKKHIVMVIDGAIFKIKEREREKKKEETNKQTSNDNNNNKEQYSKWKLIA